VIPVVVLTSDPFLRSTGGLEELISEPGLREVFWARGILSNRHGIALSFPPFYTKSGDSSELEIFSRR